MPSDAFLNEEYRTLGLEPGSKQAEVKHAYRVLAKRWHPDRHHSNPYAIRVLAEENFKKVTEAYRRISLSWEKTTGPEQSRYEGEKHATASVNNRPPPEEPVRSKTVFNLRRNNASRALCFAVIVLALAYLAISNWGAPGERMSSNRISTGTGVENTAPGRGDSGEEPVPGTVSPDVPPETSHAPASPPPLLQSVPEPPKFFTLGSLSSEVLEVQGTPTRIQGQTWIYGLSEVEFRQGRVYRYNNFDGSLRVFMKSGHLGDEPAPAYITLGSSEDDVLRTQGTPTRVDRDRWFYGFAEIRFKDGRVREYDNYFGTLKIRVLPGALTFGEKSKPFFTIGSTPDEVLVVQGTPTSIKGNLWSFNFSTVFFRDGRVQYVSDSENRLRFVPPADSGPGS